MAASEFLREKWKASFLASDLDNDGYISLEDVHIFTGRFIKYHKLNEADAKIFRKNLEELYSVLFCLEGVEKRDLTGYVEKLAEDYENDREGYFRRTYKICQDIVNYFDVNSDGFLSTEEHLVALKCGGLENFDVDYAGMYPQFKPGLVENGVYRDAWFEYHTNGDRSKIDKERPVLFGFGLLDKV